MERVTPLPSNSKQTCHNNMLPVRDRMQAHFATKPLVGLVLIASFWPGNSSLGRYIEDECGTIIFLGDLRRCEKALIATSGDLALRRHIAHGLLALGEYRRAIDAYKSIVRRFPRDAKAHYDLASAFGFLRLYRDAVAPIKEAIRLRPDFVDAHSLAAVIYSVLRRYPEAFKSTLEAARLGDSIAMFDLVWFYEHGKGVKTDQRQALTWMRRAAESGHVAAMDEMAEIYDKGKYAQTADQGRADYWRQKAREARD